MPKALNKPESTFEGLAERRDQVSPQEILEMMRKYVAESWPLDPKLVLGLVKKSKMSVTDKILLGELAQEGVEALDKAGNVSAGEDYSYLWSSL